jgi:hypothetical protein
MNYQDFNNLQEAYLSVYEAAPVASSPATTSTPDKIKSGMEVWKQQKAAGDFKSADETGKSVWALANPKLAAASAERERTRGTSATTNPLMKDMKSRLPAPTPAPAPVSKPTSPAPQSTSTPQSPQKPQSTTQQQRPQQSSPTPSKPQQSSPTPSKPQQSSPTLTPQQQNIYRQAYANRNNPLAKGRIQSELNKLTPEQKKQFQQYAQSQGQGNDWSDYRFEQTIIMNHLISEGYADTPQSAYAIMESMSEEWRESIIEDLGEVRSKLMKKQRENVSSFTKRIKPKTSFRERLKQKALQKKLESL